MKCLHPLSDALFTSPKQRQDPQEDTHATVWDTQMESVLLDDHKERKPRESFLILIFHLAPQVVAWNQGGKLTLAASQMVLSPDRGREDFLTLVDKIGFI